ncbi:hypothetical protein QJS66_07435 [Kocuria rhizophila]|nr:hypothetical protein QJS66_07435 [Kocuria rhizophila]
MLGRFADTWTARPRPVAARPRGRAAGSEVEAQLDTLGREVSPAARPTDPLTATATGLEKVPGQLGARRTEQHEYLAGDARRAPAHGGAAPHEWTATPASGTGEETGPRVRTRWRSWLRPATAWLTVPACTRAAPVSGPHDASHGMPAASGLHTSRGGRCSRPALLLAWRRWRCRCGRWWRTRSPTTGTPGSLPGPLRDGAVPCRSTPCSRACHARRHRGGRWCANTWTAAPCWRISGPGGLKLAGARGGASRSSCGVGGAGGRQWEHHPGWTPG